jgi:hypothetical protein
MPRSPAPTIEQRILAALRIDARRGNGPQTVAQLHRRPGLTGRRTSEIERACERLTRLDGVVEVWEERYRVGGNLVPAYSLPFDWADNLGNGMEAPCSADEMPSRL